MEISVIIPVYNEEDNIYKLHERLKSVLDQLGVKYEMIFVNDGSKDNSMPMIRALSKQHPEVCYIDLSRNFGHQVAVTAG
ncbi:MAG: glycosyltransferase involved in cell wall biosynthesis, partial [Saprospiraceae bacterium]